MIEINIFLLYKLYVSDLIVFMRCILCVAEVLGIFMNVMNSFISVYDDAAYACRHACA